MGISLIPAAFLLRNRAEVATAQKGLILGRQKLNLAGRRMERFVRLAAGAGLPLDAAALTQPDGYSETLFAALGYPPLTALDFTDTEGAEIIHDLNDPLPESLRGQFNLVIDGGTTEHIFHIGRALDTCHELLAPGGVVMSFVAADGWFGHGFFQTGPDVPWRYWHHARGYEMIEVTVQSRRNPAQSRPVPDPTGRPRGGVMRLEGPHMLLYAARRPLTDPPYRMPVQGHYVVEAEEDE